LWRRLEALGSRADLGRPDLISLSVEAVIEHGPAAAVVVPTRTGNTPRAIARFRLPVWILAATEEQATARHLAFSYGVIPQLLPRSVTDWAGEARRRLADLQLDCDLALLVQGPSAAEAGAEYSLRILPLERQGTRV
jgi:pyruvate kinase